MICQLQFHSTPSQAPRSSEVLPDRPSRALFSNSIPLLQPTVSIRLKFSFVACAFHHSQLPQSSSRPLRTQQQGSACQSVFKTCDESVAEEKTWKQWTIKNEVEGGRKWPRCLAQPQGTRYGTSGTTSGPMSAGWHQGCGTGNFDCYTQGNINTTHKYAKVCVS